jgi:hypothetical protein
MIKNSIDNHIERYAFYSDYETIISISVAEKMPRCEVVSFFDIIDRIELSSSPKEVEKLIPQAKALFNKINSYYKEEEASRFLKAIKEVLDGIK